ncbi:asparagine synthase (glutamine-hydrolyzing) [Flavobacterium cyanobacteriorum]|uniref:asparagine synthase (glutamine-hydrolyzing) n=1 Tax=Flavobacterium cyanobacteriorum TaxID=2022802 RepID=A0A255YSD2_9FLAO|nr:asparagine synthase (glutamine-hydrolyzing) [Flavobacterium cyanobacteriorum]OYQ32113.1 asparagine synthase (glutamine-hydrolyzing) [Flavobacterium cyanobacteriorum]
MCGITGFIDFKGSSSEKVLKDMVATLHHRGPDGNGAEVYTTGNNVQVGFGHTRLSIIDLSNNGHQPMHFEDYSILLNGEVYNYKEIKAALLKEGFLFNSDSDTEVVLKAFIKWGRECVHRFIGMFVFIIYSRKEQKLYFCRDRAGIKPLYIYEEGGLLLFASELKSFHKHPGFRKILNKYAVYDFVQYGYITGNQSIFENCRKLAPSSWEVHDLKTGTKQEQRYWDLLEHFKKPLIKADTQEITTLTESLIQSSCDYRMVADVPVGVFLSGGYDSSLVTALLQKDKTEKIKTFTIGFPDGIDESKYARQVADHLGTDHTSYNSTHKDAQHIIPKLPYYYDEPFADISAIPSILVSELAREKVTVALSADGGDELFAGYTWYNKFYKRLAEINAMPEVIKPLSSAIARNINVLIPRQKHHLKHRLKGLSKVWAATPENRLSELMYQSRRLPDNLNNLLFQERFASKPKIFSKDYKGLNSEYASMLAIDYQMNLTDCLLVKVDRASMSASLEGREPLMDHRLAEWAAQLPMEYKFDGLTHKKLLRDITHKYIPKEIMERPKVGFDLPVFDYLKRELAYLIDENLNEAAIKESGIFNPGFVTLIVKQFREDKLLHKPLIWRLLMFQLWYKKWMK